MGLVIIPFNLNLNIFKVYSINNSVRSDVLSVMEMWIKYTFLKLLLSSILLWFYVY